MVIPLFNAVRQEGRITNPEFQLTSLGTAAFQLVVVAGYLAMAISSVLP